MNGFLASLPNSAAAAVLRIPEPLVRRLAGPPHTVDGNTLQPAVQLMLRANDAAGITGKKGTDVAGRRSDMERGAQIAMARPGGVDAVDFAVPGPAGRIPVRRYRARSWGDGRRPVIVFFHGGGWVVGSLDSHDAVCRNIALGSGCTVVSVAYRLAPEHPFPAAYDDACAAFRWVRDNPLPDDMPTATAVMGDSAGGNLAAVVSLTMRDAGEPPPIAQGLIYPSTDLHMTMPSIDRFADGYMLTRADMYWYRGNYAPDEQTWSDPFASPLLAADHRGLPTASVWTAGFDPLRDEGAAYAQALRDSGVVVREHCYRDQVHGFANMGILPGGVGRVREMAHTFSGSFPV